jgi:serine/threonine-protein kinase haspin
VLTDNFLDKQQNPLPLNEQHLIPLTAAYEADRSTSLAIQDWSNILPDSSTLTKIAEASYAEVYRITSNGKSSIIKVMQLRHPTDPTSLKTDTASDVKNVVSEIRIMNALTVVPGFVRFKDAHLVQGKPPVAIARAFEEFENDKKGKKKAEASWFPLPSSYIDESTFLVIELGDAGLALENIEIKDIDQVWDVFISVVMALSRGELANEFEVRSIFTA